MLRPLRKMSGWEVGTRLVNSSTRWRSRGRLFRTPGRWASAGEIVSAVEVSRRWRDRVQILERFGNACGRRRNGLVEQKGLVARQRDRLHVATGRHTGHDL